MDKIVIDAKDSLLGRIATTAAKRALLGEQVIVVNAEQAFISGRKDQILQKYLAKLEIGQIRQGPYFYKNPERFVKRAIRGMLPHKKPRGREAYARIRCYEGIPAEFANEKIITIKEASIEKLPTLKRMSIKDLCHQVGGKR